MSGTWSKMACFADRITLAYSFHIRIFYLCDLVVADTTAAVNFPLGYVTVAPGFVGTGYSVLTDCVVYTLGCAKIDIKPNFLPP